MFLTDDTTLDMEANSMIWNKADTYSYPFKVPLKPNIHLLGNVTQMHGRSVYDALYGREFRLWVMGVLFLRGVIRMDKEVDIEDDMVEIELTSGRKTLDDMLEGVNCRDIDLKKEKICVGYVNAVKNAAINDPDSPVKDQFLEVQMRRRYRFGGFNGWNSKDEVIPMRTGILNVMQQLQLSLPIELYRISHGDEYADAMLKDPNIKDFHNNTYGYYDEESHPFCHIPICYQLYEKSTDNSWIAKRGYQNTEQYGDPGRSSRPGSAPCFYVMYIIDLLFKQLGVPIINNALKKEKDIGKLAFIHTDWHVAYGEQVQVEGYRNPQPIFERSDGLFKGNILGFMPTLSESEVSEGTNIGVLRLIRRETNVVTWGKWTPDSVETVLYNTYMPYYRNAFIYEAHLNDENLYYAIATSENLPDTDVSEVVTGIENMFGCRFMYDDSTGTMQIVMIRDVLRQNESETLQVVDYNVHKKENYVRGFRLKYKESSGSGDTNELKKANGQGDAIVTGSDDTTFNYNDWDKVSTISKNGQSEYGWLINSIGCFDETCYVDELTGNAYRVKVDKDAETEIGDNEAKGLQPSLFQVATFADVTIGDCSDEEFVETVEIGLSPVIVNDMNVGAEKKYYSGTASTDNIDASGEEKKIEVPLPRYAVFADAELHPNENGCCKYDLSVGTVKNIDGINVPIMITVEEYYPMMPAGWDIAEGFDSPLQQCSYGLTVGVLRSGTSMNGVVESNFNYDGKNNSQWVMMASSGSQITSDCVDEYGNLLSYQRTYESIRVTKTTAASYIEKYFPDSNANLTIATRKVNVQDLIAKGYTSATGTIAAYFTDSVRVIDSDGKSKAFLFTPVKDNGDIIPVTAMRNYMGDMQLKVRETGKSVSAIDAEMNNLLVGIYEDESEAETYAKFLQKLGEVHYDSDINAATLDTPIVKSFETGLSLKLKAEKYNPYHTATPEHPVYGYTFDPYKDQTDEDGYWPIRMETNAKRGLYDKYYTEYAYWLLHRKIAVIDIPRGAISISTLANISMTKKYKIGPYVGFINKISYSIDKNGLGDVTIELYYI